MNQLKSRLRNLRIGLSDSRPILLLALFAIIGSVYSAETQASEINQADTNSGHSVSVIPIDDGSGTTPGKVKTEISVKDSLLQELKESQAKQGIEMNALAEKLMVLESHDQETNGSINSINVKIHELEDLKRQILLLRDQLMADQGRNSGQQALYKYVLKSAQQDLDTQQNLLRSLESDLDDAIIAEGGFRVRLDQFITGLIVAKAIKAFAHNPDDKSTSKDMVRGLDRTGKILYFSSVYATVGGGTLLISALVDSVISLHLSDFTNETRCPWWMSNSRCKNISTKTFDYFFTNSEYDSIKEKVENQIHQIDQLKRFISILELEARS